MNNPDDKPTRLIPLTRGQHAIIDEADYERVTEYKWQAIPGHKEGIFVATSYLRSWGIRMTLGRFILNAPDERLVDHRDGNPLNNRRSNLRLATKAQNVWNSCKRKNNTSGFKGVCWHKPARKWRASISLQGKTVSLGYFTNPVLAANAYDKAAREHHGEFAKTNFPIGG